MIQIEHIQKTYDRYGANANHVLQDISLKLPDTGFVCILGESGCGKTTLMNVMGGLDTFESGTIALGEITAKKYGTKAMEAERNRQFGYIFQNYYLLSERSAAYNVYLGLHSFPLSRIEKLKRVKSALQAVEMESYARKNVGELSGGQQQRIAIARAIVRQPQVIFADEPTGNLDMTNTNLVCSLLRRISADCLVVMVTHEERIARQYADRIISLGEDGIHSDCFNTPAVSLQIKEEIGYKGVNTEQQNNTPPQTKDEKKDIKMPASESQPSTGSSFGLRALFGETVRLLEAKGHKNSWLFACLFLLTAVMVFAVGDYRTTSYINPEDFIITNSHLLEVEVLRGGKSGASVSDAFNEYIDFLNASGLDITYVPAVSSRTSYSYDSFIQMNTLSEGVSGFSYVPAEKLDASSLLYGSMPNAPDEVVVDRWTLERFLLASGVLQASITDLPHFLGKTFSLTQKDIQLKIVGICDSKEPSIYLDPFGMLSIGSAGIGVMSLSQLQALFPGKYDSVILKDEEVLATPRAGFRRAGDYFNTSSRLQYQIKDILDEDIYPQIIVNDNQYEAMLMAMIRNTRHFMIYTNERAAVKDLLENRLPENLKGIIQVIVTDHYSDYMAAYRSAAAIRVNARMIVTATILLVSAVMLLLLLKARVNERIEMIAVYRLLGVPNWKTTSIFAFECLCLSFSSALPSALLTWAVIKALTVMPSISFQMRLPLSIALLSYAIALLFHIAAALIPVFRLLRLPPAVLAGKYDF